MYSTYLLRMWGDIAILFLYFLLIDGLMRVKLDIAASLSLLLAPVTWTASASA